MTRKILLFILLNFFALLTFSQTDTFKVANSGWKTAANWSLGTIPTSSTDVVIATGCLVSIPDNSPVCRSLTINGTLSFGGPSGPYQVTVSGNVSVSSTGSITMGGSSNCYVNYSGSSFTIASGASLTMNNTNTQYTGITYSGTGVSTIINNSTSNLGNIIISSSGTLTTGSNLNINNPININSSTGTFEITAGTTVTLLANSGVTETNGGKILVDNGGTLINQSTTDMNLGGASGGVGGITLSAGATYVHQTTGSIGYVGGPTGTQPIFGRFVIDPASTFIYRGYSGSKMPQAMDSRTYGNLTFESTSGSYAPNPSGGGTTVQGNFNIGGAGVGTVLMDLSANPYGGVINVAGNTIIARGSQIVTINTTGSEYNTSGDMDIAGALTLKSNVNVGGNWNMDTSGSIALGAGSNDSVVFNGTGNQTITKINGGGVATFPYLVQNKASGSLILNNNPATNVSISTISGNVLALNNAGVIDLNGQTFTLNGNGIQRVIATGGARNIISSIAGGTFSIANTGTKTDTASSGGSLVFGNNVTVLLTTAFNPGSNLTTIASGAALQLNSGGSVITNMPLYANGSSLIYNTGATFTRSIEWGASGVGTIGITAGYPNNVTVQNNTTLNIGITTIDNRAMNGNLTVSSGSTLSMNTMDQTSKSLTVNGNVILNGTLNLASGTNTDSTAGQIFVGGNWTRSSTGIFNPNITANPPAMSDKARAVTFIGTSTSTISAPYSATRDANGAYGGESFPYLYINKSASSNQVSLASNITITREIGFQQGQFILNDSNVCIISNANNTAHVAAMSATQVTNSSISYNGKGRFIIQRYLPIQNNSTGRRWRLLTTPIQTINAPNINAAWQEGVSNTSVTALQNPSPGFGTEITDNTTAYTGNGYDAGTEPNSSLYYYNPATGYGIPTATNTGAITDHDAYFLFVRGDRGVVIGNQYVAADPTILEPKGEINTGNITKTISSAGESMVGNPYAAAINMGGVKVNGVPFSTSGTYYVWDPKLSGTSGVGGFVAVASNGTGSYNIGPNSSGIQGGIIQSGDAFALVNQPANTTISFSESNKLTASNTIGIASRPATDVTGNLTTSVYALLSGGTVPSLAGGTVSLFNNIYGDSINVYDAAALPAPFNSNEILTLKRSSQLFSIESRSDIQIADTIFYNMANFSATTQTYRLQFAASGFQSSIMAFLVDKYLNAQTTLNLTDTTNYDFNVTTDAASQATDRFMVVFSNTAPLAVNFEQVSAWQRSASTVNVQWEIANTTGIDSFHVERSVDGVNFTNIATVAEEANNIAYNFLDNNALNGNNYYRIESINTDGTIQYSKIVKVGIGNSITGISVYPNPVKDVLNLQFDNMPAGKYNVVLNNIAGQNIMSDQFLYQGGTATQTIALPATITKGMYEVRIIDAANNETSIRIIKD